MYVSHCRATEAQDQAILRKCVIPGNYILQLSTGVNTLSMSWERISEFYINKAPEDNCDTRFRMEHYVLFPVIRLKKKHPFF